jgi:hypothetical protein
VAARSALVSSDSASASVDFVAAAFVALVSVAMVSAAPTLFPPILVSSAN